MRKDITTNMLIDGGEKINKSALSRQYGCCWRTIDRRLNPEKYNHERKTRNYTSNLLMKLNFLYLSNDINEFNLRKYDLFDLYQDAPFIIDLISKEIDSFIPFLDYPFFLRKHILSFYFFSLILRK